MKKVKRTTKKVRAKKVTGRPKSTGAGVPMVVRMHEPQIKALDLWIRDADISISRPEAIRQLVNWALERTRQPVAAEA